MEDEVEVAQIDDREPRDRVWHIQLVNGDMFFAKMIHGDGFYRCYDPMVLREVNMGEGEFVTGLFRYVVGIKNSAIDYPEGVIMSYARATVEMEDYYDVTVKWCYTYNDTKFVNGMKRATMQVKGRMDNYLRLTSEDPDALGGSSITEDEFKALPVEGLA